MIKRGRAAPHYLGPRAYHMNVQLHSAFIYLQNRIVPQTNTLPLFSENRFSNTVQYTSRLSVLCSQRFSPGSEQYVSAVFTTSPSIRFLEGFLCSYLWRFICVRALQQNAKKALTGYIDNRSSSSRHSILRNSYSGVLYILRDDQWIALTPHKLGLSVADISFSILSLSWFSQDLHVYGLQNIMFCLCCRGEKQGQYFPPLRLSLHSIFHDALAAGV